MTAALINCLHGFDQTPSPRIHLGTTYSNRSYQGAMLNRKDVPKKAPFLYTSLQNVPFQQECKDAHDTVNLRHELVSINKHNRRLH